MPPRLARRPDRRLVRPAQRGAVAAQYVVLGVIVLLAVGALLIQFAPRLAGPSAPPERNPPRAVPTEAPANQTAPSAIDLTDPDLLRARAMAQSLQQRLDTAMKALEESSADQWAKPAMAESRELAVQGGDAYEQRQFVHAGERYQEAVRIAEDLVAQIPERLEQALSEGRKALETGDKPGAIEQFELALALQPGNVQAGEGLARVGVMDAVREKLTTAQRLAEIDDLTSAIGEVRTALELDGNSTQATALLADLEARLAERQFSRLMGDALVALDEQRVDDAARLLAEARQLRPDDPAVEQAQSRIREARKESRLLSLAAEAEAREAEENWQGAVDAYQAALGIDPTAGFALQRLERAKARAALDQQLEDYARRPKRLRSASVREEATQTLVRAAGIDPRGPQLQAQVDALRVALKDATTPIDVRLLSDGETEVTIYRVGDQGRFDEKTLVLKPGTYTVIGRREGYRDVHQEVEVISGMEPIQIRATEPL